MSFKNAQIIPGIMEPDQYHAQSAQRGHAGYRLSPSSIKDFARCPARWKAGYESPESKAKEFGSLIDCLALTPSFFSQKYVILPAQYEAKGQKNTNAYKAWKLEQGGKKIISRAEADEADKAVKTLRSDSIISTFLDSSDKQVMVTAEWHEDGIIIPVCCLIDLRPRNDTEFYKCLGDLKTTRSAALAPFVKFAFQMGYQIQAAFDLDIYRAAAPEEDRVNWCFILQENFSPYQTGKRMLSESFIEIGRMQYRAALSAYVRCIKTGIWPGYDDHKDALQGAWSLMEPLPYMAAESAMDVPEMDLPPESATDNYDVTP